MASASIASPRLMRVEGIRAKTVKKWRATTQSYHRFPVAANTLNRQFTVEAPNRVGAGDITYVWTTEGWLYLAVGLGTLKRELVYHRCYATREDATQDIFEYEYIEVFYNRKRRHSTLDYDSCQVRSEDDGGVTRCPRNWGKVKLAHACLEVNVM